MRTSRLIIVAATWLVTSSVGATASCQEAPAAREEARFAPIEWLVGEWRGYGQFGSGPTNYIHKTYVYEMGGMFIVGRTTSMFPPEELSTDYEIHQDWVIFYKAGEDVFKAKTFYIESFVTSEKVTVKEDGSVIVMETEQIDNAPPGMKTRMTWTRRSNDRFELHFELAMPGQEYSTAERIQMERIK